MDAKKTNLTPELKEIYDRVMNTKGTPVSAAGGSLPVSQNPAGGSVPPPLPATPGPVTPLPPAASSQMPSIGDIPAPQAAVATPQMAQTPEMPPLGGAEQALTSTPARPISEGNTFSFNGGSVKPAPAAAQASDTTKKKAKISLPILVVLGLAFIVVWGVFWAIVLGLIQRP